MSTKLESIGVALALCVITTACAGKAQQPTATARTLTLRSVVYGNERVLRVLLPSGYSDPANATRRYPVFYFLDGVAAWDAWGVPQVSDSLRAAGAIPPVIFVGIDNGGSAKGSTNPGKDRASEYLPYPDQTWTPDGPVPHGDRFPQFLFDEVMPLVSDSFRTLNDPAHVGLAGDSYAGVAALFAVLERPGRVGLLLLESPSLHIGNGRLLTDAAKASQWPGRIHLGVGTAEGDDPEAQQLMLHGVRTLNETLQRSGNQVAVHLAVQQGGTHWYDAWRTRLPDALRFLYEGWTP